MSSPASTPLSQAATQGSASSPTADHAADTPDSNKSIKAFDIRMAKESNAMTKDAKKKAMFKEHMTKKKVHAATEQFIDELLPALTQNVTVSLKNYEDSVNKPHFDSTVAGRLKEITMGVAVVDVRCLDPTWNDNNTAANRVPRAVDVDELVGNMQMNLTRVNPEHRLYISMSPADWMHTLQHNLQGRGQNDEFHDPNIAGKTIESLQHMLQLDQMPSAPKGLTDFIKLWIPDNVSQQPVLEAGNHRKTALLKLAILQHGEKIGQRYHQEHVGSEEIFGWTVNILDQEKLYRDYEVLSTVRINKHVHYKSACDGDVLLAAALALRQLHPADRQEMFKRGNPGDKREYDPKDIPKELFKKFFHLHGGNPSIPDSMMHTVKSTLNSPVASVLEAICQIQAFRQDFNWTLGENMTQCKIPPWFRFWTAGQLRFMKDMFGKPYTSLNKSDLAMLDQCSEQNIESTTARGSVEETTRVTVRNERKLRALFYPTVHEAKSLNQDGSVKAASAIIRHLSENPARVFNQQCFEDPSLQFTATDLTTLTLIHHPQRGKSIRRPDFLAAFTEQQYHDTFGQLNRRELHDVSCTQQLLSKGHIRKQTEFLGKCVKAYLMFLIFCCNPKWEPTGKSTIAYKDMNVFDECMNAVDPPEPLDADLAHYAPAKEYWDQLQGERIVRMLDFVSFINTTIQDRGDGSAFQTLTSSALLEQIIEIPSKWHFKLSGDDQVQAERQFPQMCRHPWVTPIITKFLATWGAERLVGAAVCLKNPNLFDGGSDISIYDYSEAVLKAYKVEAGPGLKGLPTSVTQPLHKLLGSSVQAVVYCTEFEFLSQLMSNYLARQLQSRSSRLDYASRHPHLRESSDKGDYIHNMFVGKRPTVTDTITKSSEYEVVKAQWLKRMGSLIQLGYLTDEQAQSLVADMKAEESIKAGEEESGQAYSYKFGTLQQAPTIREPPTWNWNALSSMADPPSQVGGDEKNAARSARKKTAKAKTAAKGKETGTDRSAPTTPKRPREQAEDTTPVPPPKRPKIVTSRRSVQDRGVSTALLSGTPEYSMANRRQAEIPGGGQRSPPVTRAHGAGRPLPPPSFSPLKTGASLTLADLKYNAKIIQSILRDNREQSLSKKLQGDPGKMLQRIRTYLKVPKEEMKKSALSINHLDAILALPDEEEYEHLYEDIHDPSHLAGGSRPEGDRTDEEDVDTDTEAAPTQMWGSSG